MRGKDQQALLEHIDALIRQGQDAQAHSLLLKFERPQIDRSLLRELSNLCRRSGLIQLGLRFLTPVIRAEAESKSDPALPEELSEYAMLLQRSGAVNEALGILQNIDPRHDPKVLLFQAFCYFNEWNYAAATPLLKKYLDQPLDDYSRLIGQVNLAASLITLQQFDEAESLMALNFQGADRANAERLKGNLFELQAQIHLGLGKYDHAKNDLQNAQKILGGIQNEDLLFVQKWKAVIELLEKQNAEDLLVFQSTAEKAGDFESVRESILFRLKLLPDPDNFNELFFGTPYSGYRERILNHLGAQFAVPSRYRWGRQHGSFLDLATGELHGMTSSAPTSKNLQVITALSQDLFRPQRIATLFSRLFPNEHFNIFSSPNRVHQLLSRTRKWLTENRIPLQITELNGQFRLVKPDEFALEIAAQRDQQDHHHRIFQRLMNEFMMAPNFSCPEAARFLGISESQTRRVLSWAAQESLVRRVGNGSGTFYSLRAG